MTFNQLLADKKWCYFISPHFDDAIYSAYGLIDFLSRTGKPVALITVFTEASSPSTLSAKKFLGSCGYKSAETLFKDRASENKSVCIKLKISEYNLGFTDALWRKKQKKNRIERTFASFIPEIGHIYPTFRFHIKHGAISQLDKDLECEIASKISTIVKDDKKSILFAPLSLGKHIDHILVRNAVGSIRNTTVVYWEDYPYSLKFKDQDNFVESNGLKRSVFTTFDQRNKEAYIKMYKSQFKAMFPGGKLILPAEVYYCYNM